MGLSLEDSFSSHWLFLLSSVEITPSLILNRQLVPSDVTTSIICCVDAACLQVSLAGILVA